jgi:hypothetical protein
MKKEMMEPVASKHAKTDEEVVLQCEILRLLINTKTFQFPPGLSPCDAVTNLWEGLVDKNPQGLHTLIVPKLKIEQYLEQPLTWDVRPFFECMLPVLVHLEVLKLDSLVCEDADLFQIAQNLPQLR